MTTGPIRIKSPCSRCKEQAQDIERLRADLVGLREALDWTPTGGLSLPRWQYDLRAAAAVLDTDAPLSKGFRVSMVAMLGKFQDAIAALAKVSGVSE